MRKGEKKRGGRIECVAKRKNEMREEGLNIMQLERIEWNRERKD
jgi:hypothetical protein